jgi:hypothetical protein
VIVALTLSIPGLVILLTVVIMLELPWRRRRTGMPVSAAGFDTLDAVFTDRRAEFEQRVTQSMWRADADQGAPPFGVDLDNGSATLPHRTAD